MPSPDIAAPLRAGNRGESRMHRKVHVRFGGGDILRSPYPTHLSKRGLNELKEIKAGMYNKGRY